MNKERREELKNILDRLQGINTKISNSDFTIVDDVICDLNDIKDDEENKLDNLTGGLRETNNAYNMERAIENLGEAINKLEDFDMNSVEALIYKLEEIK
ncbi:hypothetical protein [Clostridium gasigenes]|uniref:Uncharacterized protein n=1 Tax=Clostridium gasigenes TaxID=94869 RepID=A0A1H0S333_9CLOT|nr:hypothetical protein [Clostridium gasigenes]SDP36025.1 hypothetical protein SAMN04488529_104135 [Clostridium gasigenes]